MTTSLIYDTETTGLPAWNKPSDDPCQPRVTQIACELVDDGTREVLAAMHCIIKPEGWTIPEELEKLTGITTAKATVVGVSIGLALPTFVGMWLRADQRVAHNESFDMRMIRIELMRLIVPDCFTTAEFADEWKTGKSFCTQGKSITIINLPPSEKMLAAKRKGPKPPNLGEAYQFFTGKTLEDAHNAMVDVMACKAVYFGILDHNNMYMNRPMD